MVEVNCLINKLCIVCLLISLLKSKTFFVIFYEYCFHLNSHQGMMKRFASFAMMGWVVKKSRVWNVDMFFMQGYVVILALLCNYLFEDHSYALLCDYMTCCASFQCIKQWVYGREMTCPTCRRLVLFPEEFPKLGK